MGEKINGFGNGGNHNNKWGASRLSFSYHRLLSHELSIPSRNISAKLGITEKDIRINLEAIKRLEVDAPPVQLQYNYSKDKLYFNVARTEEQELKLELTHVDHYCRWNLHERPLETYRILSKSINEDKLKVEFNFAGGDWEPIDLGDSFSLLPNVDKTEKGMRFSIRVKGGTSEKQQKALLDILLAFKCEEERDMERDRKARELESEANAKKYLTRWVAIEDFQNIPAQARANVIIKNCAVPNMMKGERIGVPGRVVIWRFYRDFAAVKSKYPGESRDKATLEGHFAKIREVIDKIIADPEVTDKDNWEKYIAIFKDFEKFILAELDSEGKISIDNIEKILLKWRDLPSLTEKARIDFTTYINYLAKSLLGEEVQNKISETDKPVILMTTLMTPAEAKTLPDNVVMLLAPDMPQDAHAGGILTQKGIKYYRPGGKVAKFIRKADPKDFENKAAHVVMANNNMWLNVRLPENIYQYLISLQRMEEAEYIRDMALNILARKIHGGPVISIKATVNDINIAKASFIKYIPDGLGLVRTEMLEMDKQLSAEELRDAIVGLCNAATVKVDKMGMAKDLPVTIRLLDVGGRRDNKDPVWIKNEGKLKGAAFLLCDEGKKILKSQFRACLLAHLERRNQIRVMIPYIENPDQFDNIKDILQEVKNEIMSEISAKAMADPSYEYAGITLDSLGIFLGVMIENSRSADRCGDLSREAHFCSLGLNDLRYDLKKETILEPEMVKIISEVIKAAKKTSTPVSVCGEIINDNELILLMALGIGEISVDFRMIPKFSSIIRSLEQKQLEKIKEGLSRAKSQEEIKGIIEAGRRHLGEWQAQEASLMAAKGYSQKFQNEQIRFAEIHNMRIQAYSNIMQIIRSEEAHKEEKIDDLLHQIFTDEHKHYVEFPSKEDISKWLQKEMLIISFLDEWEIREALKKKCRCTPYIFFRSPDDGAYWARAIPRGGDTGSKSRYYIKNLGPVSSKDSSGIRNRRYIVDVNYFNSQENVTKQAPCVLERDPDPKKKNIFKVIVPLGDGKEETVHLLSIKEGRQREFYRRISGEKLFIAKAFDNTVEVPPHSSIYRTPVIPGTVPALFIQDRSRMAEIAALKNQIDGLPASIRRDGSSAYYQPKDPAKNDPFNVNQILYFKMREVQENMSYLIGVDNWLENKKEGFQPLLDDPTRLAGIVQFLGVETKEDEILVSHIKEIKHLHNEMNVQKREINIQQLQINEQQQQIEELKAQLEGKKKELSSGT